MAAGVRAARNRGPTLDLSSGRTGEPAAACAVVRSPGRLALSIAGAFALALLVGALARGVPGALDVALYAAPFLVIATLLLSGRFIGEERILAAYRAWPRRRSVARRARVPELQFDSALERAPRSLRGPPAVLSA